jgi:nucleotide-binding universal stress UspA family protein
MTRNSDARTRFHFRALLVPVDLTPASDRILGRVALLPLAEGARVTLLHVVPSSLPAAAQRRAQRDAKKALAEEARHLARSLPANIDVVPMVTVGAAAFEIAARTAETRAEMIVMGRAGGGALRDTLLGSTAERVVRRTQRPVLVVRLPARGPYRRPALALDFDRAADAAVAQLLKVIPPPRPRVTLIHACDPPYHGLIYPSLSEDDAEDYRDRYRDEAVGELEKLLAAALSHAKVRPADAPAWTTHVRLGSPRNIIGKAIKQADSDLLALGTHGWSGLAHLFLGTVAGQVLRAVHCDVLVVPPGVERA